MATTGSADRPGTPASAAAGRSRPGLGSSAAKTEAKRCAACVEAQAGVSSSCGRTACPLCFAQRHSDSEERLRRKIDTERSRSRAGRGDGDNRRGNSVYLAKESTRSALSTPTPGGCSAVQPQEKPPTAEFFASPALIPKFADVPSGQSGKHKPFLEDRDESRRRNTVNCKDEPGSVQRSEEPGVLSDSENEEPISSRIRNISAFIRKTKTSLTFTGGSQRSRSCTDPVEDRGGTLKVARPNTMDQVSVGHSSTAGILLSSENSRSVSAPITAPDRRFTWRVVVTSSTPLVLPPSRPERSISPDSNDSISEELNHFKPIVCSPCTPPKRLPDGRLMEPTIVKSTPRNLTRGLQKATSYEASPAVLQKWRQIELDRQSLKVNSKATLTSPVVDLHNKTSGGEDSPKTHHYPAGGAAMSINKRRLLFEPPVGDVDNFQKQSVKIRVPAVRYSSESAFRGRGSSDFEPTAPESCSGGTIFSRKQSFSPCAKHSGFQSCKLVPRDSQSPKKESDSSIHKQSTSRRGKKRKQKTKHQESDWDSDLKRSRSVSQEAVDERYMHQTQQERQDRALALKLQRQFDLENQMVSRRRSPDKYFLRSWRSNQNRRRRGLRRSRRLNKKH